MTTFDQIKDALRPLLEDDRFHADNFSAIENVCNEYLGNVSAADPRYAQRDTGIYLILSLAGELNELWEDEQPLKADRRDSLRDSIWPHFQRLARTVLDNGSTDLLFAAFQNVLRAVFVSVR